MTQFGECAICATEKMKNNTCDDPRKAWDICIFKLSKSEEVRKKSCPRNAFLGLCEEGLVRGVEPGKYNTKSFNNKEKEYAFDALKILYKTSQPITSLKLWRQIVGNDKAHNSQMDVVLSLWENDLIIKENIN